MNRWTSVILVAGGLLAASASAQTFEITPFYGYQLGGRFESRFDVDDFDDVDVEDGESYGLLVDVSVFRNGQVEFLYSRQSTELQESRFFGRPLFDLDVEYLHGGFLYQWTPGEWRPYVVGSLGATRFELAGGESDSRFSVGLGGGVKVFLNDHLGLRFEGRFYSTFIEEDEEVFCESFRCVAYDDSTYFTQFDLKAGILFAF